MGVPPPYGFRPRLAAYAKVVRTLMHRFLRRTDQNKWRAYGFPKEWELRSSQMAAFVPPGSTVYEFGAGSSNLARFLPETCTLISSDVIERRPGMLVIDLNRRPFPRIAGSGRLVAVFGGVLEYLADLPAVLQWAGSNFDLCIASYECAGTQPGLKEWLRSRIRRSHEGWVNHYTQVQLSTLFADAGYRLLHTAVWGESDPGMIYLFQRSSAPDLRQLNLESASAHIKRQEQRVREHQVNSAPDQEHY